MRNLELGKLIVIATQPPGSNQNAADTSEASGQGIRMSTTSKFYFQRKYFTINQHTGRGLSF